MDRETISIWPELCPFCEVVQPKPFRCECSKLWGQAAKLIKRNLWLSDTPPPSPDSRPWHMGRECSIYKRLLRCGRTAEEINGALTYVQDCMKYDGPRKLTMFYGERIVDGVVTWVSTPTLEQAIHYWNDRQFRSARQRRRGMGDGITIKLEVT